MQCNIHGTARTPQPKEVIMKTSRKLLTLAAAMFAFAAIMTPQAAMALTAPCTEISNQATLDYFVGGVNQPDVTSDDPLVTPLVTTDTNPTKFNVGVKVLLTVVHADAGYVTVTPSDQASGKRWLSYYVTNDGNATHQYDFSFFAASNTTLSPFGVAVADQDTYDVVPADLAIYVENSAASNVLATYSAYTYVAATDTGMTLTLAPGMTNKVYIVYTPDELVAVKDTVIVEYLKAITKWANGSALSTTTDWSSSGGNATGKPTGAQAGGTCDGTIGIDIVFGDGDGDNGHTDGATNPYDEPRDGSHSAKNAFKVANAVLVHTKAVAAVWDPVNLLVNPQMIPGAIVEYSLAIENTGNASAVLTDITDQITTGLAIIQLVETDSGSWTLTTGARVDNVAGITLDIDNVDTNNDGFGHNNALAPTQKTVTVEMDELLKAEATPDYLAGELKAGEKVTVKFKATVQ